MTIEQENTVQTQEKNRDSEEEMSWSDIAGHFLGELVPGRGRIVTCLVILVSLLIITLVFWGSFGWRFYEKGPTGNGQKMSQITVQKIRLVHRLEDGTLSSEVPPWIHENIPEKIYKTLLLTPSTLSIYSEKQIEYVQNALKTVFWIQKVERIRKFYPAFLEIEVTYRRPAMLVSVAGDAIHDSNSSEPKGHIYIPISSDCCILPMDEKVFPVPQDEMEDFPTFCGEAPNEFYESEEMLDITEFSGCEPPLSQTPGNFWSNDSQIRDAMKIVTLLGDRWKKFGLDYICVEDKDHTNDANFWYTEKHFCLVTKNGSRIHWGSCMEKALVKDDVLDVEKIEVLDDEFDSKGYLDTPEKTFIMGFQRESNNEKPLSLSKKPR